MDGLGSTNALTDDDGNVVSNYRYDAYGQKLDYTGAVANKYLFAGEQFDTNLKNYYLRARYYSNDSGQFLGRDTYEGELNEPLTLHKYIYTHNNPINGVDPSGYLFTPLDGILVGQAISRDFISASSNRLANREINTIVRARQAFNPTARPYPYRERRRPDLIDVQTQELYEIKTRREGVEGYTQLLGYISLLNNLQVNDPGWREGTSYTPPSTMNVPVVGRIVIDPPQQNPYAGSNNGVITYDRDNNAQNTMSNIPVIDPAMWAILFALLAAAASRGARGVAA